MYKSIPDGFKVIMAEEGLKGFTLVSTKNFLHLFFVVISFPKPFTQKSAL